MSSGLRILWLEGIFDEATIDTFPAISPAVNFWHTGFVQALEVAGCEVTLMGHAHDRIWPKGRAVVHASEAKLPPGFSGQVVGYLNLPALRARSQTWSYLRKVKAYIAAHCRPDFVVTFNDTPATSAARFMSRELGVPWLFISGDGPVIPGADGYLYQNWVYFESNQSPGPKIHLDGGLPLLDPVVVSEEAGARPCALMYMGALTAHGGAVELVRAFHTLEMPEAELWITGRGLNKEIEQLAAVDSRIKLYGFVNQQQLHELASRARVFANPRPTTFAPNKLNYPSKLLHYLAYGRPVLSTFTDGLSPDYREVLIPMKEESEAGIAESIYSALRMNDAEYAGWCDRVSTFNSSRAWSTQAARLLEWMKRELNHPFVGI